MAEGKMQHEKVSGQKAAGSRTEAGSKQQAAGSRQKAAGRRQKAEGRRYKARQKVEVELESKMQQEKGSG